MSRTVFFRLLTDEDKESALGDAVDAARQGGAGPNLYATDSTSFWKIPGSPFAYWVSETLRRTFTELPRLESEHRTVRVGLQTSDDFRFVRTWWEVDATSTARSREDTLAGKRWVAFAKGGQYSRYYADLHLVLNWAHDGDEMRAFEPAVIRNPNFYFRAGLTWPRSTVKGFNVRVMPRGCIFADKGPSAFVQDNAPQELLKLVGLMNSTLFERLLLLQTASRAWEVGLVQQTPVPNLATHDGDMLGQLTLECIEQKRFLDHADEHSHAFRLPSLVGAEGGALLERLAAWPERIKMAREEYARLQAAIDDISFRLYGLSSEDRLAIETSLAVEDDGALEADEEGGLGEEEIAGIDRRALVAEVLSYAFGVPVGRWDVRIALDPTLAPRLQGRFDPLPICSPGMLVGPNGLPATSGRIVSEAWLQARPDAISLPPEGSVIRSTIADTEYPLRIDWDGILVDDPDHPDDIVRRVREVLHLLWGDRADEIEAEAAGILGVKVLRDYFRNPKHFWDFHVKRYSKSRRKAPIYWLLQSPKRNYAIWLYYHRLDPDILFKALVNYVEPKIRLEEDRLSGLGARRQTTAAGSETRRLWKAIDQQEALLPDLHEFRDRLDRAAQLHLRPDLDDGVLLNIAPLWELVPWKDARRTWEELLAGKYEWSAIGKQLRERGLV